MMKRVYQWGLLAGGLVLAGLAAAGGMVRAEETVTEAQPPLPEVALTITDQTGRSHAFRVEVASTPRQQEVGEMFRKEIKPDHGMLFVWPAPQESAMWMRNTFISLDMIFIDDQNRIHAIEEHTTPLSEGIISSHGPVRAVLELPAGTAERLGLVVGNRIVSDALPGGAH
ncbi:MULTISPECIES: DUF192 domain-containing protein [Acetobacteraceae]|nr:MULTISPECIES: DUF192 domain-containing protein [Acetobacteraceae]MCQ0041725.1 DUF192 domain-containing protein [Bombella sp.]MCT6814305.1 DUF192 domain-containing protein [Bombella apis]MCT6820108.1 DUF192 domain-containing protein [Bombella apis]CDG33507.1 hypothetical protein SACS_0769 [Parasaccharibacter apium]